MSITFEALWPLLLLVGLVPLAWAWRSSLIEFHPRQVDTMLGLRAAAFVLAVLALMQPVLYRSGSWLSVVWLVDVSRSVDPRAVEDGIAWIEQAESLGRVEASRFVAFGGNAVPVDSVDALRSVRVSDGPVRGAVDRSATDLHAALERALAAVPPYYVPRVVLLSDGNDTRGEVDDALEDLLADGVSVYTHPARGRREGDAWVDSVGAAAQVTAGLPFDLNVGLRAQVATDAWVTVRQGDQVLARQRAALEQGASTVTLQPVVDAPGAAELTVELEAPGDPLPDNNVVDVALRVRARPRVLYVEGVRESAHYLRDALEAGGFDVTTAAPAALPIHGAELDGYDAVIVSDVAPEQMPVPAMYALTEYVEQLGGGLIFAGGESVYGEDGYSESQIERLLPIWFKAEREPKDLALVVALDKSYSMVGDKMALAKEASIAALDLLEPDQKFGLLAFDYHFYWPVPIQDAQDKERIRERIGGIEASSPTNIYPALQDVYESLLATDAEVKHVILLSDGKTYEDDYEGLVTRMADADMTVSTVAVGDKADIELMTNIAKWGKGRTYAVEDPTRVPEIFIDETQMAQGITIEEGDEIVPVVKKPVEALAGLDMDEAPPLLGYIRTLAKDSAEVILETEEEDPLLARWQYGLGRATFFAPDVKNRWSARWIEWDGYGKFWAQLVRENMRQRDFLEPDMSLVRGAGRVRVVLDLVDSPGPGRNALRPQVEVVEDGGEPRTVELAQVAPGRYEAAVAASRDRSLAARWEGASGEGVERRLAAEPPAELRFRPPNEPLLRRLAERTGGAYDPDPERAVAEDRHTVVRPLRLAPGLAALALLLYLLNMLLRRVRVFRDDVA